MCNETFSIVFHVLVTFINEKVSLCKLFKTDYISKETVSGVPVMMEHLNQEKFLDAWFLSNWQKIIKKIPIY